MKGNIFACLNICQNFVLMDISWEYVMAAQLQQLCRTQLPHPFSLMGILRPQSMINLSER